MALNLSNFFRFLSHRVSAIFMLHFVEGLPHKDLEQYSFHFGGCLYHVTSVVQYQANNHFITWILDADGKCLNFFFFFHDNRCGDQALVFVFKDKFCLGSFSLFLLFVAFHPLPVSSTLSLDGSQSLLTFFFAYISILMDIHMHVLVSPFWQRMRSYTTVGLQFALST